MRFRFAGRASTPHQLPAAAVDEAHPAVLPHRRALEVVSRESPRRSNRKPNRARHLGDLTSKAGEKFGLVCGAVFVLLPLFAFSQGEGGPVFRAESNHVEVGPVTAGSTATATFVFRNDGDRDIRILRAAPS